MFICLSLDVPLYPSCRRRRQKTRSSSSGNVTTVFVAVGNIILQQVFEGLPDGFSEDQDTVVRYMKLLPPVFSDEDRRAEAAAVRAVSCAATDLVVVDFLTVAVCPLMRLSGT